MQKPNFAGLLRGPQDATDGGVRVGELPGVLRDAGVEDVHELAGRDGDDQVFLQGARGLERSARDGEFIFISVWAIRLTIYSNPKPYPKPQNSYGQLD